MIDRSQDSPEGAPRRTLFGRLAAAMALGVAAGVPGSSAAQAAGAADDGPAWPGPLKGRHRQVVDAYAINGGAPLAFVWTFLAADPAPGGATAVLVLRHDALPIALNSAIWAKYRIGEGFKITDPETQAHAVKNPFLNPKPGVPTNRKTALDHLLSIGTVVGACGVALHGQAKALAHNAGVSPEEAAREWAAGLVPGVALVPSGTWAVNRAQEAGCTYCAGG